MAAREYTLALATALATAPRLLWAGLRHWPQVLALEMELLVRELGLKAAAGQRPEVAGLEAQAQALAMLGFPAEQVVSFFSSLF